MIFYCPSYTAPVGACPGRTPYANLCWSAYVTSYPYLFAGFSWAHALKETDYKNVQALIPAGTLLGKVPGPQYADYSIYEAICLLWPSPGVRWYTPDRPGIGPGKEGGPLYLNFVNGIIGADMYIDGFLKRKT